MLAMIQKSSQSPILKKEKKEERKTLQIAFDTPGNKTLQV